MQGLVEKTSIKDPLCTCVLKKKVKKSNQFRHSDCPESFDNGLHTFLLDLDLELGILVFYLVNPQFPGRHKTFQSNHIRPGHPLEIITLIRNLCHPGTSLLIW